jgi:hypothetical protein
MTEAKIEIKIGQIQFSGQGDQDWIAKQLDKIVAQAEKLIELGGRSEQRPGNGVGGLQTKREPEMEPATLPKFLGEKNATTNQVKKFLATAVWLELKGKKALQTKDVSAALKDAHQNRLGNAADCLNKNVSKGFCEKSGNQFIVTEEGKQSL